MTTMLARLTRILLLAAGMALMVWVATVAACGPHERTSNYEAPWVLPGR